MRNYILPILTALVLSLSSCQEEAAKVTDTVKNTAETSTNTVKETAAKTIEATTNTVNNTATEIKNITKETVANTTKAVTETTSMKVDRLVHDFGTITDDKPVSTTFTITNTGKKPLIISQAKGSCGCTVPTYPKTPIAPGETGNIEVTFNPKGKAGAQNKTVTLIANTTPANTVMNIKSVVNKTVK